MTIELKQRIASLQCKAKKLLIFHLTKELIQRIDCLQY